MPAFPFEALESGEVTAAYLTSTEERISKGLRRNALVRKIYIASAFDQVASNKRIGQLM